MKCIQHLVMVKFVYPTDIYEILKEKWNRKKWKDDIIPPIPNKTAFQELLDVVYHASLLTEEARRVWFRVMYTSPTDIRRKRFDDKVLRDEEDIVEFDRPRPFSVSELVKLAPAADPTQVLICVRETTSKKLEIWGLVETGTSWWDFEREEAGVASPPPNAFTVGSTNPGQISISRAGDEILTLDQGIIVSSREDVFCEGPVGDFLGIGETELYRAVCKSLRNDCYDPDNVDDDYPKRFYISFLKRVLIRIREGFHGGTLLIIPDEINTADTRLNDRISIKYVCHYDAWKPLINELTKHRTYYDLLFDLWGKRKQVPGVKFDKLRAEEDDYEEAQEMVKRAAGFLSSLSAVDGAVVMTHRFRLLGFGAEIIAQSPTLKKVKVVSDLNTRRYEYRDIEHFGTRHRSAFRFCSSFEDSVAFIVSHDGNIRVAKRTGSEVSLWPNVLMSPI